MLHSLHVCTVLATESRASHQATQEAINTLQEQLGRLLVQVNGTMLSREHSTDAIRAALATLTDTFRQAHHQVAAANEDTAQHLIAQAMMGARLEAAVHTMAGQLADLHRVVDAMRAESALLHHGPHAQNQPNQPQQHQQQQQPAAAQHDHHAPAAAQQPHYGLHGAQQQQPQYGLHAAQQQQPQYGVHAVMPQQQPPLGPPDAVQQQQQPHYNPPAPLQPQQPPYHPPALMQQQQPPYGQQAAVQLYPQHGQPAAVQQHQPQYVQPVAVQPHQQPQYGQLAHLPQMQPAYPQQQGNPYAHAPHDRAQQHAPHDRAGAADHGLPVAWTNPQQQQQPQNRADYLAFAPVGPQWPADGAVINGVHYSHVSHRWDNNLVCMVGPSMLMARRVWGVPDHLAAAGHRLLLGMGPYGMGLTGQFPHLQHAIDPLDCVNPKLKDYWIGPQVLGEVNFPLFIPTDPTHCTAGMFPHLHPQVLNAWTMSYECHPDTTDLSPENFRGPPLCQMQYTADSGWVKKCCVCGGDKRMTEGHFKSDGHQKNVAYYSDSAEGWNRWKDEINKGSFTFHKYEKFNPIHGQHDRIIVWHLIGR